MDCPFCAKRPPETIVLQTPLCRLAIPGQKEDSSAYWVLESKRHLRYTDSLTTLERETLRVFMRHANKLCRGKTGAEKVVFIASQPNIDSHLHWYLYAYMPSAENSPAIIMGH